MMGSEKIIQKLLNNIQFSLKNNGKKLFQKITVRKYLKNNVQNIFENSGQKVFVK